MVRAAMSVSANIVEGREQRTDREFARFLGYALASASELEHHFIVGRDLRAITNSDFTSTLGQIIDVRKMVHGLLAKLAKSKKSPSKRTVPSTSADSVKRTAGSGQRAAGSSVVDFGMPAAVRSDHNDRPDSASERGDSRLPVACQSSGRAAKPRRATGLAGLRRRRRRNSLLSADANQ